MSKICIGKVVKPHGIKGEIRILSNFQYKDKIFKIGNKLIINNNSYTIRTYRKHKNYDMVQLNDYNNINQILDLVNNKVYILKENLELDSDEILDEDLLDYRVVDNNNDVGQIKEVFYASPTNKIIRVMFDKEVLIPFNSPIINKIDKNKKIINVNLIDNMK